MATISPSNCQALCDAVAAHIIAEVGLIGSPSAIVAGQATSLGHVAGLGDASQEFALIDAFEQMMANENAWLTVVQAYNTLLDGAAAACAALDAATAGLAAFLQANSLQVDPHFLDAFNHTAARRALVAMLGAFLAFGNAVANLGQISVTGASTGTFAAGTPVNSAYGNAPLSLVNAGGGNTGASSTVATVTYNKYNASGVLQTGQTATATMPGGSTPGTAVALSGSAAGIAVTGISVTSGNSGDTLSVKSTLLRAAAY